MSAADKALYSVWDISVAVQDTVVTVRDEMDPELFCWAEDMALSYDDSQSQRDLKVAGATMHCTYKVLLHRQRSRE